MPEPARAHLAPDDALTQLPAPPAEQYAILFRHGTLTAGVYAPRGIDDQTPHTRDEVYVVVRGTGTFVNGAARRTLAPGDLLFVPAHVEHRFEDFSNDLAVWVLFYGPDGGETA